jgi:MFS family permease
VTGGRFDAPSGDVTSGARRSGTSFGILRRRDFAIFWGAALVSSTGNWMQTVTVPFVVYDMTRSTAWLGFAAFMSYIPGTVSGMLGGSLADRYSRRRMLLTTQTVMMGNAILLWTVWVSGAATPGLLVAIVGWSGLVTGLNAPTWQSFVTQLVERDEIVHAVRLNSMQFVSARAFGPAIAGIVLQTFGPGTAFMANAASFVFVLGALLAVRPRPQRFLVHEGSVLAHLRAGWQFVRARPGLLLPILAIGFVSLLGTSVVQLAPAVAGDQFDVGRGAYGFLVAAFGLGALAGSVAVAFVADRWRRSALARWGLFGVAAGVIVLGSTTAYAIGVAAMCGMGVSYTVLATSLQTSVQARVEDTFRGRTMSLYTSALLAGVPLGALVQGKLAELIGLRAVVVGAGVLLATFGLVAEIRFDRLRLLDGAVAGARADPLVDPLVDPLPLPRLD